MTAPTRRPTVTMPSRDDLAADEIVIAVTSRPDSFDRVSLFAYWLDDYLPADGVRAQVFHVVLAEFVARNRRRGQTVRGFNDQTAAMLADLNIAA